jgi:hypothetical protein
VLSAQEGRESHSLVIPLTQLAVLFKLELETKLKYLKLGKNMQKGFSAALVPGRPDCVRPDARGYSAPSAWIRASSAPAPFPALAFEQPALDLLPTLLG